MRNQSCRRLLCGAIGGLIGGLSIAFVIWQLRGRIGLALQAMWQDAKGQWDTAHKLAQAQKDETGAWVHAYLHRVEGDLPNAAHWYRRAGKPRTRG